MKEPSRTKNSLNNLYTAWIGQILNILIQFVARTIFINTLGAEYLGLNGLFTNVVSVFSFAELGIGSAIVYSLYKPLALKDKDKIDVLLSFYRKCYRYIGFFVLIAGTISMPFIGFLIKDIPDIKHLHFIYELFVINTGISYFYSYKSSFLMADQKSYIYNKYQYSFKLISNIIQMGVLIYSKNFIFYLIINILFNISLNLSISKKFNNIYPELNIKSNKKLDAITFKEIKKNISALVLHKVGSVVVGATDNIILSKFLGLFSTGIYSNYKLVFGIIDGIMWQMFLAILASVGNLKAQNDIKKQVEVFNTTFFVNFWTYGFCSICLTILINPFLEIWLGDKFTFDFFVVIILGLNFYVTGMRKSTMVFKDAFGLFWHDRYKPLFEAIVNLTVSVILVKSIGVSGIFIGTFISTITTCFWIEPYVLYKYGFNISAKEYFIKYIAYGIVTVVSGIVTLFLCNIVNGNIIISFLLKMIICVVVPNIVFSIVFYRTKEFQDLLNRLKIITNVR